MSEQCWRVARHICQEKNAPRHGITCTCTSSTLLLTYILPQLWTHILKTYIGHPSRLIFLTSPSGDHSSKVSIERSPAGWSFNVSSLQVGRIFTQRSMTREGDKMEKTHIPPAFFGGLFLSPSRWCFKPPTKPEDNMLARNCECFPSFANTRIWDKCA